MLCNNVRVIAGAMKPADGENRLLETTIKKQNVAKLKRELIYIYKLPPATDEDYEHEELNVNAHHRRGKTAGGVWFFDDLDTDDDYLDGHGNNKLNTPGSGNNKGLPHRFSPGKSSGKSRQSSIENGQEHTPHVSRHRGASHSRFHSKTTHANVKAEHAINKSQQPGTELPLPVPLLPSTNNNVRHGVEDSESQKGTEGRGGVANDTQNAIHAKQAPELPTTHGKAETGKEFGGSESSSLPEKVGITEEEVRNGGESKKKAKYYNTGHFRKPHAIIWDPHPQYIFHAFGHRFHLLLNLIPQRHSFLTPHFTITTHSSTSSASTSKTSSHDNDVNNESFVWRDNLKEEISGCFYNGFVLGDPNSSVAVSLCHGMVGCFIFS
jgi:hypothetical protein